MKCVTIRTTTLGGGVPKICVPLVEAEGISLQREALALNGLPVDIAEWRADRYEAILEPGCPGEVLSMLRQALGELPLLFTFRTHREGGSRVASLSAYASLLREAICSGMIDAVDIELFSNEDVVKELTELAHRFHVKVILSNHDFQATPSREELLRRLSSMEALGADIAKIAVTPEYPEDVLTLLSVTSEAGKCLSCPVITMSMKGTGLISRLSGEIFGSCLTFGAVKEASAPGQIYIEDLKKILDTIHSQLERV